MAAEGVPTPQVTDRVEIIPIELIIIEILYNMYVAAPDLPPTPKLRIL